MGATNTIGTVLAKLEADTASFDAKMKASGETATASQRAIEKATKQAAEAQAFAAKFAGDAVSQQTLRIVNARKQESQAYNDLRQAQRLAKAGYEGEESSARLLGAALQRVAAAKKAVAEASEVEAAASHASISQMQATSAAVRSLEGNPGIRATERFLTTIPGVGMALQAAFPIVGAVAFGSIIVENIEKIRQFIQAVNEVPDKIQTAFRELDTQAQLSNDELKLSNDRLQNEIDKLQGRPQNNLAIAIDETRIAADKLSKSLEEDAKKVKELLEQNKITAMGELLTGKGRTGDVTGSVNAYRADLADLGFQLNVATHQGDQAKMADLQQQIAAKEKSYTDWLDSQIRMRTGLLPTPRVVTRSGVTGGELRPANEVLGDQSANLAILRGERSLLYDRQDQQAEEARTGPLQKQKDALESQKQAGANLLKQMEEELNQQKLVRGENIKADFDFWEQRRAAFTAGSEQYRAIVAKEAELAVQGARQAHEKIQKFLTEQKHEESGDMGAQILGRATENLQREGLKDAGIKTQDMVDSNQLALLNARNDAREREAEIIERVGASMTHYAAAVELAKVHEQEFQQQMQALEGILHTRQLQAGLDPSRENNRAVAEAQAAIVQAQAQRGMQIEVDQRAIYGRDSSGLVGATDALNDFVKATRDSATEMRNLTDTALKGLNNQIVRAISGQRTDFSNMGADLFRHIAGIGLEKAEGNILSMFGLGGGKKPTGAAGDPLHVIQDNPLSSFGGGALQAPFSTATLGGDGGDGGGGSGILGTAVSAGLSFLGLPGFADGGAIDPNQWAIVGEEGPELFHSGGGGTIVPNHKLESFSSGGDTHHWNIDARGASDPAAVHAAVMRAAPAIAASAVKAVSEGRMRRPSTRR